jgi:protein dithiol:quinone oxidoreductase
MLALLDRPRLPFALLVAVCGILLAFGLYLQYSGGLEPCPMCILQRYAFTTVILVALAGALHGPTGRLGRGIYAGLLLLASLAGGGIAAWQSWIQRFPPDISECGPDLAYMLDSFPLTSALPMIFRGAGECTRIDWSFLGLSIANWSLVCFILIAVAAVLALSRPGAARG